MDTQDCLLPGRDATAILAAELARLSGLAGPGLLAGCFAASVGVSVTVISCYRRRAGSCTILWRCSAEGGCYSARADARVGSCLADGTYSGSCGSTQGRQRRCGRQHIWRHCGCRLGRKMQVQTMRLPEQAAYLPLTCLLLGGSALLSRQARASSGRPGCCTLCPSWVGTACPCHPWVCASAQHLHSRAHVKHQ